jgi:hypothetical protein
MIPLAVVHDRLIESLFDWTVGLLVVFAAMHLLIRQVRRARQQAVDGDDDEQRRRRGPW